MDEIRQRIEKTIPDRYMAELIMNREATLAADPHRQKHQPDHKPVVKLFLPGHAATWLLTELYDDDEMIAFGLCDLGLGFPELGPVSLLEIFGTPGRFGYVERDQSFVADKTLSEYAHIANGRRRIVA